MMDQQGAQPQGGQESGGGQPSPGEILATLDQLLGVFGKMVAGGQVDDSIKKAAVGLQAQFRSIVEAATKGAGGGGGGPQGGQPQPTQPQPVRSQGTPMGQH